MASTWCWELSGSGLDSLALVERELRLPGPDELLVRIDACGICFSDIKILNLGPAHPRLQGRDMVAEPIVMGHEAAMTVVEAGSDVSERFPVGSRYLIQADVYFQGRGMAFGYLLPGGFSQYQIIGREILGGDEGCYLLPVSDRLSHAQAALCEPWACVEASYAYQPRKSLKPGGRALLLLLDMYQIEQVADELPGFRSVTVTALTAMTNPWLSDPSRARAEVKALLDENPGGFDDVLIYGLPNPTLATAAATLLAPGGVLAIQGQGETGPIPIDVGSVHYRNHWYTGLPTGNVYRWDRTAELAPRGVAWFIGAGGPIGQMHIERSLTLPSPPSKIIISQNGGARLDDLRQRFAARAAEMGISFVTFDAKALGSELYDLVKRETGGHGCDDICVVVPNAEVIERAYTLLAPGGGMNIFAGVAVGAEARIDIGAVPTRGVRMWGTSGSSIADLKNVLDKVEAGGLATDRVVAAVGGLPALKEGLHAVREGIFVGKTLIYPHCKDLPLLTVEELAERHPEIAEVLFNGRYWTPEAETALLKLYGGVPVETPCAG